MLIEIARGVTSRVSLSPPQKFQDKWHLIKEINPFFQSSKHSN